MTFPAGIYPISTGRDARGRLCVAGLALSDLAGMYGTPLYVYDALTVRSQSVSLKALLKERYAGEIDVTYAAKAYFSRAFAEKMAGFGLGVDVVSLGELRLAQRAGFPPEGVHLHGNNKSPNEIKMALEWGIHAVVVDSLEELELVEQIAAERQQPARIWLRVTPGLTVDTHPYRQTGHASSKFGLPMADGQAAIGIRQALSSRWLKLTGLHTHLGSQIFETEPYRRVIAMLASLADSCGMIPEEISPGGGWGVPYTAGDEPANPALWAVAVCESVSEEALRRGWPLPRLVVEPGRWLTARAGLALYSVGTHKTAADGSHLLAVDGGMADNPRPALYHSNYTACLVDRPDAEPVDTVRLVGKFCESGDELIHAVALPAAQRGEVLAMPAAGAYQLSMASNYNMAARPAVLWLEEGRVEVLQAREAAEDSAWIA